MEMKPFDLIHYRFSHLWCIAAFLSAMFSAKGLLAEQDRVDKPSKAKVVEHIKKLQMPWVSTEQIRISLSGAKDCGMRDVE